MEGGQFRDSFMLRMSLVFACAALAALGVAATAGASSPAADQYGSALPSGGNGSAPSTGGGAGGSAGTPASSGDAVIPVVPGSGSQAGTPATGGHSSGDGSQNSNEGHGQGGSSGSQSSQGSDQSPVTGDNTSHSVPQIASNTAGDGWVPFFIAGLVALAGAAAVLVYRNRRRTAQG